MRTTRSGRSLSAALALFFTTLCSGAFALTYSVTTTADSGAGSLRQAILDANANSRRRHDRVQHHRLGRPDDRARPRRCRRSRTGSRSTDTRSRERAPTRTPPTRAPTRCCSSRSTGPTPGPAAKPPSFSSRPAAAAAPSGASSSTAASGRGSASPGSPGCPIDGNFIGTDPTGTVPHGNTDFGIQVNNGASSITIGGTTPAARNLISGNGMQGINFGSGGNGGTGHLVQGNLIGTDASGGNALAGKPDRHRHLLQHERHDRRHHGRGAQRHLGQRRLRRPAQQRVEPRCQRKLHRHGCHRGGAARQPQLWDPRRRKRRDGRWLGSGSGQRHFRQRHRRNLDQRRRHRRHHSGQLHRYRRHGHVRARQSEPRHLRLRHQRDHRRSRAGRRQRGRAQRRRRHRHLRERRATPSGATRSTPTAPSASTSAAAA